MPVFFVAVLMALPVLLPALMAYLRSGRGGGLFDEFWYGFTFGEETSFDISGFFDRAGTAWYRKYSYILSDSVFVVLTLVWLFRSGLKTPLSKFMLLAGATTLLPVFVDEAMLLMNMGSYMSYALRFGFLNALYFWAEPVLRRANAISAGKKHLTERRWRLGTEKARPFFMRWSVWGRPSFWRYSSPANCI